MVGGSRVKLEIRTKKKHLDEAGTFLKVTQKQETRYVGGINIERRKITTAVAARNASPTHSSKQM